MSGRTQQFFGAAAGLERPKTVVCVTDQRRCDRIIKAGRALADMTDTELAVINIARPAGGQDPDSIEYLFGVARDHSAEMTILYAADVAKAIIRYVKENKVSYLLTGIPQEGDSITSRIWKRFTHVTFFVVEQNGELREILNPARAARALVEVRA